MRKNCSSDRGKPTKFEAEGQAFSKILRSLEQFIQTVKGQNNFWQQNAFLTSSWRFLISNELEQLEFKLEKILGFKNMQEKLEKIIPTHLLMHFIHTFNEYSQSTNVT